MIDNINQHIGKLALVCDKRPLQYATITSIALTALSLLATTILMSNGIWLGVAICVLSSVVCILGTVVLFLVLHARAQAIDQFARKFPVFRNGTEISLQDLGNLTDVETREVIEEIAKLPGDWTLQIDNRFSRKHLRNLPRLLRKKNLTLRERYELGESIRSLDFSFSCRVLSEIENIPDFVSLAFPKKSAPKEKVFDEAMRTRMVDSFLKQIAKLGCHDLNRSEIISGKLDLSDFTSLEMPKQLIFKQLILEATKLLFLKELIVGGIWINIPPEISRLTELTTLTCKGTHEKGPHERVYLPVEILNLQKLSKITFHLYEFDDVANKIRGISEEASPDLIYEMICLFDYISNTGLQGEVLQMLIRKKRNVSIQTIARYDSSNTICFFVDLDCFAIHIVGNESVPFQHRLRWKFDFARYQPNLLLEVEQEAKEFPYWQLKARVKRLSGENALDAPSLGLIELDPKLNRFLDRDSVHTISSRKRQNPEQFAVDYDEIFKDETLDLEIRAEAMNRLWKLEWEPRKAIAIAERILSFEYASEEAFKWASEKAMESIAIPSTSANRR